MMPCGEPCRFAAPAQVLFTKCVEKPSEKGRKSLQWSLIEHRNGTFRPISASPHRLNPRLERCSYPFSDSFRRGILRSSPKIAHLRYMPWSSSVVQSDYR